MKLEDQVAPLALAQRMKELGFPQETCFAWVSELLDNDRDAIGVFARHALPAHGGATTLCAAPTVAEMGEWLPLGAFSARHDDGDWVASHPPSHDAAVVASAISGARTDSDLIAIADTEAEARARLLIALAESGALDPKSVAPHGRSS